MSKKPFTILKKPYLSEKTYLQGQMYNTYAFIVEKQARKKEIKENIERFFNVKVIKVRTINIKDRKKRLGKFMGWVKGKKKALVTLHPDYSLDFFAEKPVEDKEAESEQGVLKQIKTKVTEKIAEAKQDRKKEKSKSPKTKKKEADAKKANQTNDETKTTSKDVKSKTKTPKVKKVIAKKANQTNDETKTTSKDVKSKTKTPKVKKPVLKKEKQEDAKQKSSLKTKEEAK